MEFRRVGGVFGGEFGDVLYLVIVAQMFTFSFNGTYVLFTLYFATKRFKKTNELITIYPFHHE